MRTRGEAHQETRRQILKAARQLVAREGHDGVSLRHIAARAGFSPASLYEYFESKEAIFHAIAEDANAQLRLALEQALRGGGQPRERLVRLGLGYIHFALENPDEFMLLFSRTPSARRGLSLPPPPQSSYRLLLETVSIAIGAGELKVTNGRDAEAMAYGLWATVHGMAMLQLSHLEGFSADFLTADRRTLEALVEGFRR